MQPEPDVFWLPVRNNAEVKALGLCAATLKLRKARRNQFYSRFAFKLLFPQFTSPSFSVSFLPRVKMNSTN